MRRPALLLLSGLIFAAPWTASALAQAEPVRRPAPADPYAAHIAEAAAAKGTTLREEAIASGKVSAEDYDRIVQPHTMIGDGLSGA